MSAESSAPRKLIIKPIVISNNQKMVIKSPNLLSNFIFPAKTIQQYKDEVIYSSPDCDFLKGESQEVLIVNRLNLLSRSCRTIARSISRGVSIETTSDAVISVIGQKNYETVLSALSSVFNEETKVRGILALLTTQKKISSTATQTEKEKPVAKNLVESSCQTVDTRFNMLGKEKQKKRVRRQPLAPYVVTESQKLKKLVINVDNMTNKNLCAAKKEEDKSKLPDLKLVIDEDSNISAGSVGNLSLSSLPSVSESIVGNPDRFFKEIDKVTDKTLNSSEISLRNGSRIMVPRKPEDIFHIAAPDILRNVTHDERRKLIWQQAFIDFKMCLEQDEDGYYPLHVAVLNNDVDLVRRQCLSLRSRQESVDIPAGGLTALHMAVRQNVSVECTKLLLQNGADPLLRDQDRRCSLHLAAEADTPQLRALLTCCDTKARSVLKNNKNFWHPELESQTDEQLTKYLYECISQMFDDEGYTPLMIAAEAAIPSQVALLASRAGRLVDAAAPNCGATALYRATAKACLHAKETGNRITAPDNILKTIEILVEHGADPSIENHSGSSVNTLLTEFNISALSMTIANKMTAMKHGRSSTDGLNMMILKNNDGKIHWVGKNGETNEKNKTTEVRYIPPNLLASITVDIPETKTGLSKKSEDAKVADNVNIYKDKTPMKSDRIDGNSLDEVKCSKIVNSNELKIKAPKVVISNRSIDVKDFKLNNVLVKNGEPNSDIEFVKFINELGRVIKNEQAAKATLNKVKDGGMDTNPILQQVKLGNVILKHAKPNFNISVKEANVDKASGNKKITVDPVKVSVKVKDGRFGKPVTLTRVASGITTEIKQNQLQVSPNIVSSDTFLNSKHTSLDVAVSKQIKIGNVAVKNADETEKNFSIFQPVRHQNFQLLVKDAAKRTNLDVAAIDGTSNLLDIKRNRNKRLPKTDSEEKPTRSGKERKTETVVIVENVAIKKGFTMPNILKSGTCKTAKPKDIVISPKASDHTNVSPEVVIGKDDVEKVNKLRKRKHSIE